MTVSIERDSRVDQHVKSSGRARRPPGECSQSSQSSSQVLALRIQEDVEESFLPGEEKMQEVN